MVAVLALSLGAPGAHSAWLQAGYDAARTGAVPESGPAFDEVAWTVQLPGGKAWYMPPLVLDGQVFVLLAEGLGATWNGIARADLATGRVEVFPLPHKPSTFATDRQHLFVARDGGLDAYPYPLAPGAPPVWTVPFPRLVVDHTDTYCIEPAVSEGVVYVGCTDWGRKVPKAVDPTDPPDEINGQMAAFVVAVEAASGQLRWMWVKAAPSELQPTDRPLLQPPAEVHASATTVSGILGISVIGQHVLVTTISLGGRGGSVVDRTVWSLATPDGALEWSLSSPPGLGKEVDPHTVEVDDPPFAKVYDPPFSSYPTGTPREIYVKNPALLAINPARGSENWRLALGREDQALNRNPSGFALQGTTLFVAWADTIYRVDTVGRNATIFAALPPGGSEVWGNTGHIATPERLYARSVEAGELGFRDRFYAYAPDGAMLWRHTFADTIGQDGPRHFDVALGEGVLAVAGIDGSLTLLGRTGASLVPAVHVSTWFPGVGEAVSVDLSATAVGAFGPATAYRAAWGDGTSEDWQPWPSFRHTYSQRGAFAAVFEARNPAGQTASEGRVFRVGETPPEAPLDFAANEGGLGPAAQGPPAGFSDALLGFAFPGTGLLALALMAAVALRRQRHGQAHPESTPLTRGRLEAYRAALEGALKEGGPTPRERALLARMRQDLQISEHDHALLEYAIGAAKRGSGAPAGRLLRGQLFLDRYRIGPKLGEGGSAETFLCRDERVARDVVLKVVRSPLRDARGVEAVLREARAVARVKHPNVVTLLDVEQVGQEAFLVMEHVEGGSLRARLARGPLGRAEIAALARDVLRALEAVHAAGLVHRDVKPSNLLLTREGHAKLADFGIAHLPGFETTAAAHDGSSAVGTIQYMSPEQARGHQVSARSDLFSAAATLYEALTGTAYLEVRRGESAVELQMRAAAARPFDRALPGAPALRPWFARALAPSPAERFASAAEMLQAFEQAWAQDGRLTPGPGTAATGPRR